MQPAVEGGIWGPYLWGLCLPCLSLSRIHCQTFWERSVASRGRRGEETPSPPLLMERLHDVLPWLKETDTQNHRDSQGRHSNVSVSGVALT